jgi:hypothetical protein
VIKRAAPEQGTEEISESHKEGPRSVAEMKDPALAFYIAKKQPIKHV